MYDDNIYFMALGGAQSVGASCYYLRLGGSNLLLDCGVARRNDITVLPKLHYLLASPFMDSLSQLDKVYISHAHGDHVGYLPELMQQAPQAAVYLTAATKFLAEHSLAMQSKKRRLRQNLQMQSFCREVSYLQTLREENYNVTFYPAGHLPGAMMTLFEYRGKRILYTGDYSFHSCFVQNQAWLPVDLDVDILIICALHANRPSEKQPRTLADMLEKAYEYLSRGYSVWFRTADAGRTMELLLAVNNWQRQNGLQFPVFLKGAAMEAALIAEKLRLPILSGCHYNCLAKDAAKPHIAVSGKEAPEGEGYKIFGGNYTLHESYAEMKEFIKILNPRLALLVHCPSGPNFGGIARDFAAEGACRTQFIFPQEGQIFML
ncbi:MAG: MBL fold metallo-hydrolase [Phascolarctobacterium sp.]|uniref:MBL fold metallo-hydrolase n=1 Tax=Phascolarctobacterium sp. TaxID=2049039 RepID=UPI0026DA9E72|nr:MBL fold metallo-hydrolase [Phascolarctobacterium sp.]MDO4922200.1 MBL fold metallo-hydrolase [Phascolarctobacterium sp.]